MLRRLRIENLVLIKDATIELAPGMNALTGETGAGKTIFAEALGLLLGNKGDATLVGSAGNEAFVEAEFDPPVGLLEGDEELAPLLELRPEDEPGIVLARRVFADGRTRAYAWGRSVAREDLAAAAERLIAMSGQFEQRRLARPAYQLDVLDRFVGDEHLALRRAARVALAEVSAARRKLDMIERDGDAARSRLDELRALVADTVGLEPGQEDALRAERERMRHVSEIGAGLLAAIEAIEPEDGEGAAILAARAEAALVPLERVAPDLGESVAELRGTSIRLREVAGELSRALATLETDPARIEQVEGLLDRIATVRRRYSASSLDELLDRRAAASEELDSLSGGTDPLTVARADLGRAEVAWSSLAGELTHARRNSAPRFATAVAAELRGVGMGDGEFEVEVHDREPGPSGKDAVQFLVRPNAGLPLAPVAQTASGGELSRIALAIAAVGGGETLVFDEIDAGIGGVTAHDVAGVLTRLAERAQVVTITHLPQIANVADRHFRVEKVTGDPTHTRIDVLDDAERRDELERMLGGEAFVAALTTREGA